MPLKEDLTALRPRLIFPVYRRLVRYQSTYVATKKDWNKIALWVLRQMKQHFESRIGFNLHHQVCRSKWGQFLQSLMNSVNHPLQCPYRSLKLRIKDWVYKISHWVIDWSVSGSVGSNFELWICVCVCVLKVGFVFVLPNRRIFIVHRRCNSDSCAISPKVVKLFKGHNSFWINQPLLKLGPLIRFHHNLKIFVVRGLAVENSSRIDLALLAGILPKRE